MPIDLPWIPAYLRVGVLFGDTDGDVDRDPDVIWADEGDVSLEPVIGNLTVTDENGKLANLGQAAMTGVIKPGGRIAWAHDPESVDNNVIVVDLTDPSVNPRVETEDGKTHTMVFRNVKSNGALVFGASRSSFPVRIAADQVDEFGVVNLASQIPATAGAPVVVDLRKGDTGTSVTGVDEDAAADGDLVLLLSDGESTDPVPLPIGPPGVADDPSVADLVTTPGTETEVAIAVKIEAGVGVSPAALNRTALAAADAAAIARNLPVLISPGTYAVASNLTITSPVQFHPAAILKPSSGVTVTLAGGVDSGPRRIADHSLGGVVVPLKTPVYHPAWWGPVNSSDDTTTFADMNAAKVAHVTATGKGVSVQMPDGVTRLKNLTLNNMGLVGAIGGTQIKPVAGTVTAGDFVVELGSQATLRDIHVHSDSIAGIQLIKWTGTRSWVDGCYIQPIGAGTWGIYATIASGSITPRILNTVVYDGTGTGDGIYLDSPDAELIGVWVGLCNRGIVGPRGTTTLTAVHVWGCTADGITVRDGSRLTNVYTETNGGWGLNLSTCDRVIANGVYAWKNGATVPSTGGIYLGKGGGSSSCRDNILQGIQLDDNYGDGLVIDGALNTFAHGIMVGSATAQGGGTALGTNGVHVTNHADNTQVDMTVRGRASSVTGKVFLDDSTARARVDFGNTRVQKTTATVMTSTTTLSTILTAPVEADQEWLVEGHVVVDSSQAADFKMQLQATSATGATGYFGVTPALKGSASSTTTETVNPVNAAAVAVSGGSSIVCGTVGVGSLQMISFRGYVKTSTVAGNIDLRVAPNGSDATNTTVSYAQMNCTRLS